MEYRTTLEQDIEAAIKIMDGKKVSGYDKIYSWTNEVLPLYYNYRKLQGKRASCPTASGDHPIHAAMAGASYIDAFDINPLAKYYSAIKIAILRTYNYNYMYQFLFNPFVNRNINLNDISWNLTEKQLSFWKEVFRHQTYENYNLYHQENQGYYSPMEQNCDFFNKEGFDLAQKNLLKAKINYHDLDIADPNQIKNLTKYDALFLSNIHEYAYRQSYDLAKNCSDLLLPNGILYQYHCNTNPDNLSYETCEFFDHEAKIITIKNIDGWDGENCGVNVYRKK